MSPYNSMYFNEQAIENGEHLEFIKVLMNQCYSDSGYYNDIHIIPSDCGAFVVEWCQKNWDNDLDCNGKFEFVDIDQAVMKEIIFPDNTIQYALNKEEENDMVAAWCLDNPGWHRDIYDCWEELPNDKEQ